MIILVRSIPAPSAKPIRGMIAVPIGANSSRIPLSMLPISIPRTIGIIAASSDMKGIFARPEAPSATSVKDGPSFSASSGKHPQSAWSP